MIEKDYSPRGVPAPCGCEWESGSWTVCNAHRSNPEGAPWVDAVGICPNCGPVWGRCGQCDAPNLQPLTRLPANAEMQGIRCSWMARSVTFVSAITAKATAIVTKAVRMCVARRATYVSVSRLCLRTHAPAHPDLTMRDAPPENDELAAIAALLTAALSQVGDWEVRARYVADRGLRIQTLTEPDANCVTLPDGSCVSPKDCMHGPALSAPALDPTPSGPWVAGAETTGTVGELGLPEVLWWVESGLGPLATRRLLAPLQNSVEAIAVRDALNRVAVRGSVPAVPDPLIVAPDDAALKSVGLRDDHVRGVPREDGPSALPPRDVRKEFTLCEGGGVGVSTPEQGET